jgi:hypothetical protein
MPRGVLEQVAQAVQAGAASDPIKEGFRRDIARLGGDVPVYASQG